MNFRFYPRFAATMKRFLMYLCNILHCGFLVVLDFRPVYLVKIGHASVNLNENLLDYFKNYQNVIAKASAANV